MNSLFTIHFRTEEAGIELQILGGPLSSNPISRGSKENNNSNDISQANSAISIDYPEQLASTIGNYIGKTVFFFKFQEIADDLNYF